MIDEVTFDYVFSNFSIKLCFIKCLPFHISVKCMLKKKKVLFQVFYYCKSLLMKNKL